MSWWERYRATLIRQLLRLLSSTWRMRDRSREEVARVLSGEVPCVILFWHGKMFPIWHRFRGRGFGALISGSRDGEVLARYLRSIGYGAIVRGSSSRGGGEALRHVVDELKRSSMLITPDGPRGPARRAKAGGVVAARRAGCRVLLVTWSASRTKRLRSWDSMELPYPFSRIECRYCIIDPFNLTDIASNQTADESRDDGAWVDEDELAALSNALDELENEAGRGT